MYYTLNPETGESEWLYSSDEEDAEGDDEDDEDDEDDGAGTAQNSRRHDGAAASGERPSESMTDQIDRDSIRSLDYYEATKASRHLDQKTLKSLAGHFGGTNEQARLLLCDLAESSSGFTTFSTAKIYAAGFDDYGKPNDHLEMVAYLYTLIKEKGKFAPVWAPGGLHWVHKDSKRVYLLRNDTGYEREAAWNKRLGKFEIFRRS